MTFASKRDDGVPPILECREYFSNVASAAATTAIEEHADKRGKQ